MVLFLEVAHITVAAIWLGHKLLVPFDLRTVTEPHGETVATAVAKVERAALIGQASGLLTLLTGVALILAVGGPGSVPDRIYVGAGIVIVMFIVGAAIARPAWIRVRKSIDSGDRVGGRGAVRRLNLALLIESVLWVAALSTMVS